MRKVHSERLLKLAEFLRNLPRKAFDLNTISSRLPDKNGMVNYDVECAALLNGALKTNFKQCGATACAIGWMPAIFPRSVYWNDGGSVLLKAKLDEYEDEFSNYQTAEKFFGIDMNAVYYLFDPCFYPENRRSAKSVATRIESFVESNGEVPQKYQEQYNNEW